ncbi:MAG: hypothetical protein HY015_09250 [Bacteroidetes bacterium]|nr:hypothetical protein [Bacteroidota bacterium]MBI3483141.1 hypothetical protein [Bacteroidota bacterium]
MFNKITRHALAMTLVLMGVFSLQVSAQFSVGAKLGGNLNQFTQPGTTIGFSAGGYAAYKALPFLTAKVEPQYSMQGGARQSYYIDYSAIEGNVAAIGFINPSVIMHNIEVPILAELTLPEFTDETMIPKLILGGSYTFMVKATETSTHRYIFNDGGSGVPPTPSVDVGYQRENVTDNYTRNQFSLIVGFGMMFKTDKRDFQFDIRYRQGITQVNLIKYPDAINKSTSSSSFPAANGIGGNLYTSSLSFNFSMTIFNF